MNSEAAGHRCRENLCSSSGLMSLFRTQDLARIVSAKVTDCAVLLAVDARNGDYATKGEG